MIKCCFKTHGVKFYREISLIPENWASIYRTLVLRPKVGASNLDWKWFTVFRTFRKTEKGHLLWLFGRSRGRRCRRCCSRRRSALLQAFSCQVHCQGHSQESYKNRLQHKTCCCMFIARWKVRVPDSGKLSKRQKGANLVYFKCRQICWPASIQVGCREWPRWCQKSGLQDTRRAAAAK